MSDDCQVFPVTILPHFVEIFQFYEGSSAVLRRRIGEII